MSLMRHLRDLDGRAFAPSPRDPGRAVWLLAGVLPCLLAAVALAVLGYVVAALILTVIPPLAAAAVIAVVNSRAGTRPR